MWRLLSTVVVCCCLWSPAAAERFLGRVVEITDSRQDRAAPAPLVISLHGFLGTGANMRKTGGRGGGTTGAVRATEWRMWRFCLR